MKNQLRTYISTECPWRDTLYWYDTADSTNTLAKALAKDGAPHGTVLVAEHQTGGRGRMGRSFLSPPGGVYLSAILRPDCPAERLMHLTCAAAVAGVQAVKAFCGISPGIKWTNDLVYGKKKLGGILTELGLDSTGHTDYAIVGIGINCRQRAAEFPLEIRQSATSLREITKNDRTPLALCGKLIEALYQTDRSLLTAKDEIMDIYRRHCVTLGKEISLLAGDSVRYGTALDLDQDGGLLVRFSDGSEKIVTSGEVSIRGMYGYV